MSVAEDFFQSFLKQYPQAKGGELSVEELNKLIAEFQHTTNNEPTHDFNGLSPAQMHVLLYDPLSYNCLLQIESSNDQSLQQVPLLQLAELLIKEIHNAGKLKLTDKGNLPVRICELLFNQQLIRWEYMEYLTRIREEDIPYIWPLKQYLMDQGIVKKQGNALSLTKYGEKFMNQGLDIRLINLILFFGRRFHWGNFYNIHDGGKCGQLGWAYSLWLLQKYGDKPKESEFYSQKLIQAFEKELLVQNKTKEQQERVIQYHRAYAVRFFDSFANWFGLVNIERKKDLTISFFDRLIVTKSPLLDRLFKQRAAK